MKITFTNHAREKFSILERHGCVLKEEDIIKTLKEPDSIRKGRKGRLIAQRVVDEEHLLRVVYEEKDNEVVVVTFYPARRERYED